MFLFVAAGIVVLVIILSIAATASVRVLTVIIGTPVNGRTGTTRRRVTVIGGAGAFVGWFGGALGALSELHVDFTFLVERIYLNNNFFRARSL